MSYQVLARKWRPRSFKELVGQTHVLQALVNALDQDRLHHAYLFTGTRGVGKTTIARILAKCLNCETGVSSTPCGQCSACCEIDEGRFVDLIEVDAASRTKVEDTRELLDNVQYAPTRGRYKVYLIDEVHMLSVHSFNALLKTLEEPPPHVKFLLATTDPQKLPVTILSRCLQFGLKNMTPERIVGHLENILGQEAIPFEGPALWQLARAADGSMRDSLSLTDQAIAFGNGQVTEQEVSAMLGTIDQGQVMKMVRALSSGGAPEVLAAVANLAEHAPDYRAVLDDMLSMLHRIAIAQAVPEAVDNSQGDREQVLELAGNMLAESVQLYYQVGLIGKRDLPLAPDPRGGFEMALLRMLAFRPEPVAIQVPQSARREVEAQSAEASEPVVSSPDPEPEPAGVMQPESQQQRATEAYEPKNPLSSPMAEEHHPHTIAADQPATAIAETPLPEDFSPSTVSNLEPAQVHESDQSVVEEVSSLLEVSQKEEVEEDVPPPISTYEAYASEQASRGMVDQPEPESTQVKEEPVQSTVPEESISFADLNVESWVPVFRSLPLGGVTRTIASHCEYVSHSAGRVDLRLDSGRSTLYNDTHRQRLEKALSDYFDQPLRVQVEIGQVQAETPAAWRERKMAERMADARSSIFNDQHVQGLINEFSAVVIEDSIQPVGNVVK
ncbi:DNA polymerase III subunit gamma/tau [Endozoicomonas sp. 8E]|uniref:DNA polymerase III subunit gamma/tau n=1 Tax=Endozoicomonas sp. 8E TaxID=3035692 RepID=UPI0029390A6F|nr:DNA polymerase III subunit gamma/tau [Endozoicomonas sp. 8E]WOG29959.1 DNA polymerase III subunit gamma/tau [Endozoicomonas sp. 8E]